MRPPLQIIVTNIAGYDRAWALLRGDELLAAGALEAGRHTDEDLREVFRGHLESNRIPALIEERERWLGLAEQIPILRARTPEGRQGEAQLAGSATRIAEALEGLRKLAQAGGPPERIAEALEQLTAHTAPLGDEEVQRRYLREYLIAHRQSALQRLASRQLTDVDVPHEIIDYAVVRLMQGAPIEEIQKEAKALKERGALLAKALRPLSDQPGDDDDGAETESQNSPTIRFALGSWWTGHTKELALRLHHLLIGAEIGFVPLYKEGTWQIDSGGNWLLRIEEGRGELQYRYAMMGVRWTALRATVGALLGVKLLEGVPEGGTAP